MATKALSHNDSALYNLSTPRPDYDAILSNLAMERVLLSAMTPLRKEPMLPSIHEVLLLIIVSAQKRIIINYNTTFKFEILNLKFLN